MFGMRPPRVVENYKAKHSEANAQGPGIHDAPSALDDLETSQGLS
jgi:hypothetical protein